MLPELEMLLFAEGKDRFAVICEDGSQWTNLPFRVIISKVECTKDYWNSIDKLAFYKEAE